VIIFSAVLSWLVAFDIVNTRSRFVYMLWDGTRRLTAPLLDPVRRILPDFGGIDISPIVVLVAIFFLQSLLRGIQF
jgi:YggT family protein